MSAGSVIVIAFGLRSPTARADMWLLKPLKPTKSIAASDRRERNIGVLLMGASLTYYLA